MCHNFFEQLKINLNCIIIYQNNMLIYIFCILGTYNLLSCVFYIFKLFKNQLD